MLNFNPNPLFFEMVRLYKQHHTPNELLVICNEGGSRSAKTYDAFHFIYMFCDHNRDKGKEIYILRNTLTNCRDYTLKDFKNCIKIITGEQPLIQSEGQKPYCNLFGNHIFFRGLDDEKNQEGYPSDIVFVNESLEIETRSKIAGIRMRCRMMMIFDWNPKFTQHWCFDMEGQKNTFFTHSTYKNNKHLQKSVVNEIESYCPWHFDDFHLQEKERRPHPVNCETGTADLFRWKVYGEGIRSAPEGLIFENVQYIDEWPEDVAHVYGQDFGFTNDPSALVKVGETSTDIYLELLMYEPTPTASIISDFYKSIGMTRSIPITADSSDKYTGENKGTVEMVIELQNLGWPVSKVSKTKSIIYWIEKMKGKRINIVRNHLLKYARKEQENYKFKTVNGIAINQPIDKFNHFWDGSRYGFMSLNEGDFGFI
jgi:PBSX family phage terminase large subunit